MESSVALRWGTEHEKSGIVTLLKNIDTIRPAVGSMKNFHATGNETYY